MPDLDPNAPEPMDAQGTRVTPAPDEHPGHEGSRHAVLGTQDVSGNKVNPDEVTAAEGGTGTSGARGGGPAANFTDQR
jgi:hypothetical protein